MKCSSRRIDRIIPFMDTPQASEAGDKRDHMEASGFPMNFTFRPVCLLLNGSNE